MDSPRKLSPIEKALIGNHICPHDNGEGKCCGAQVNSYQHFGNKNSADGQSLRLTCTRNHSWLVPIVEE